MTLNPTFPFLNQVWIWPIWAPNHSGWGRVNVALASFFLRGVQDRTKPIKTDQTELKTENRRKIDQIGFFFNLKKPIESVWFSVDIIKIEQSQTELNVYEESSISTLIILLHWKKYPSHLTLTHTFLLFYSSAI